MPLALLTLLSGLAISAVAIYYSVIGLAAIFSAAVVAIMVMGAILEVAKLVAAWWLKANWHRAPILLKSYMLISVIVLMLITSMGIFGFLSKAHSDQAIVTGDVQAQVYLIDEQIKVERENIGNAQSLIKQLDDAVVGINASGVEREFKLRDGTTRTQSAAERALQVRRSQAKDRANLTAQIEESQTKILALQEKKAPIAANMREVEAKVGPIKYIAQLIYGEDPNENLLEKAVTWVIITIVFVFDPLAILLLLASQMSFQWARQEKEERKHELVQEKNPSENLGKETSPASTPDTGTVDQGDQGDQGDQSKIDAIPDPDEGNKKLAEIEPEFIEPAIPVEPKLVERDPLKEWNEMIAEAERAVGQEQEQDDHEILENANLNEKEAMHRWKAENPEGSLKIQRMLLKKGKIEELPWMQYLRAEADFEDTDADAAEAAKWAMEQLEAKKKDNDLDGESSRTTNQEKQRDLGYIQNSEQSDSTIWKRIKDSRKDIDG